MEWTNAQKIAARVTVNLAVRKGTLPPASSRPCVDCGHFGPGRRHEYHHKSYAPDRQLDVEPLCSRCHKKRDSAKANQTHCIRGHRFTPENTKRRANGTRECRQCRRDREAETRDAAWWRARRRRKADG